MFKAIPISAAVFISDLNKAIIEAMVPEIYIRGDSAAVSNISLSTAIIELTVLLTNDSNTNKIEAPTGRAGSISPINAIFWFFKRYSLSGFSV